MLFGANRGMWNILATSNANQESLILIAVGTVH
jgi:hypothetical protein